MSENFAVVRKMSGNWPCQGIVRGMSEKNLVRENCYNVWMVWVVDTDCDIINAKTLTV